MTLRPLPVNYCVVDERLSRSGEIMPIGDMLGDTLKELGITTVICLKDRDKFSEVQAERSAVETAGIAFLWRPMTNRGIFSYRDINKVDEIIQLIEQVKQTTPGRILVHCRKGSDRSSVICAAYRITRGWSVEDAIAEGRTFGWAWYNKGQRSAVKRWARDRIESK